MPDTQTTNAVTVWAPSENVGLSQTLLGLEESMERAARENLAQVLATQGTAEQDFSDLEMQAMVETEKLRLANGIVAEFIEGKRSLLPPL